jgi:hypothetical protein
MRSVVLLVVALTAIGATCLHGVAGATPEFTLERLDPSHEDRIGGVLLAAPSGDLVATDLPANCTWVGDPAARVECDPVRILVRHAGAWTERTPAPPQDSSCAHDLATDSSGKLYFLSWQSPWCDESRPILEEETGSGWNATVLDTGWVYQSGVAIDAQGQPWVAMLRVMKHGYAATRAMVIAHRTALGWSRDSLELPGAPAMPRVSAIPAGLARLPFRLDPAGRPQFLFSGANDTGLFRAVRTEAGWNVDTIDATVHEWSTTPVLTLSSDGVAHVLYADNPALWHATRGPSGWMRDLVTDNNRGVACALTLDHAGKPRVLFSSGALDDHGFTLGGLFYAWQQGAAWTSAFVNDDSLYNPSPQLLLDDSDSPLILHNDPRWRMTTLATLSDVAAVTLPPARPVLALALASGNPGRGGERARWSVTLPEAAEVTLEAFDITGRCIATSEPRVVPAGPAVLDWTPPAMRPGSYFVCARTPRGRSDAVRWVLVP